jgi:hypothetical protein
MLAIAFPVIRVTLTELAEVLGVGFTSVKRWKKRPPKAEGTRPLCQTPPGHLIATDQRPA